MDPMAGEPAVPGIPDPPRPPPGGQPPSDGQLVARVRAGEKQAFEELVRRYQRQAVAVSYRLLGNTHDALEVTQDALLKAYSSLGTLEKPEAFGGWLMRIVSNLSLNYRRGRATRSRSQLPLGDLLGPMAGEQTDAATAGSEHLTSGADPARSAEGAELGERLKRALSELPERQRQALLMFTIDGLPQKDVAEALNMSVEAVKWHVFQARRKLREMLQDVL
jgi:RNA polymerase sigma-70 factor (ECF subfamily)